MLNWPIGREWFVKRGRTHTHAIFTNGANILIDTSSFTSFASSIEYRDRMCHKSLTSVTSFKRWLRLHASSLILTDPAHHISGLTLSHVDTASLSVYMPFCPEKCHCYLFQLHSPLDMGVHEGEASTQPNSFKSVNKDSP